MAAEHDLAQPRAWSMGVAGWCLAENGEPEAGLALVTQAIAAMHAMHSRHFLAYLLGLLAAVHFKAGHDAQAMEAVQDGLVGRRPRGTLLQRRAFRLRGELLARASGAARKRRPHSMPPSRSLRNKAP